MDKRQVTITGIYVTDLLERTTLYDSRCPDLQVTPNIADDPKDASLRAFTSALYGKLNDVSVRRFKVEVSGRFQWNQTDTPEGSFEIDRVVSFERLEAGIR